MNNTDAYKSIQNSIEQLEPRIKDIQSNGLSAYNEIIFEDILKSVIIPYMWSKQFPEHFLNCYVTTDEYDTNNCSGYSWYMFVRNSHFNFKKFKVSGSDIYHDRTNAINRMNNIIISALECDNIIMWCVNHFC